MGKSQTYTDEFIQDAVRLADQLKSVRKAASQLGISHNTLFAWKGRRQLVSEPRKRDVISNDPEALSEEIRRLRRENDKLNQVNDILKRAAAFFSQDHLK